MTTSTKACFALITLGGVAYVFHQKATKKKAEDSRKRRGAKKKKAA